MRGEKYLKYLSYIEWKLRTHKITNGQYHLFKISESEYNKFANRLENDETFLQKIIKVVKMENRDKRIEDIVKK